MYVNHMHDTYIYYVRLYVLRTGRENEFAMAASLTQVVLARSCSSKKNNSSNNNNNNNNNNNRSM